MGKRRTPVLCLSCSILLLSTGCKNTQARTGAEESAACRQFAQSFYEWYAPLTQKEGGDSASDIVLQRKAAVLSDDLFKALKADSDAQTAAKGDLVGIDFDPFVSSQDPADHYEARAAKWTGGRCLVEVWRASPNDRVEKTGKPAVIAELARENGQWRFLNLRYPGLNTDLVSVLSQLREDRRKFPSNPEKPQ